MIVAFSGIDGAGKTSLIRGCIRAWERHRARTAGPLPPWRPLKLSDGRLKQLVARHLHLTAPEQYLVGDGAYWHAIAASLDFLGQAAAQLPLIAADETVLVDRYVDCYVAYAALAGSSCARLVERLLADCPRADLTIAVEVPPEVAWERLCARPGGPAAGESLAMLRAFQRAYRQRWGARPGILVVDNAGPLEDAVAAVLARLECPV